MPGDPAALNFKPGQVLKADDLQTIADAINRPGWDVRGGGGIDVRKGARGQTQITGTERRAFVGSANGDIPPRSGTAWGQGSVSQLGFDGTDEYSLGVGWDVYNPSSNTMTGGAGIANGQRCFVQEDEQGRLIVSPLECS
jgi:hypothetical protein